MGIECAEVKFSSDQGEDNAEGQQTSIAARLTFGGPEQAVQRFRETIGHVMRRLRRKFHLRDGILTR